MDLKELAKLAQVCRKHGIKSFKNEELEFTLTEDLVVKETRGRKPKITTPPVSDSSVSVPEVGPTEEELLFWSSGIAPTESVS